MVKKLIIFFMICMSFTILAACSDNEAVNPEERSELPDIIALGGKEYDATYFGEQDLTGFEDFKSRKFWRLENAYDDFKDNVKPGDKLPYGNYPMEIEIGQVFVIDVTKTDGSVVRMYYRSDGLIWHDGNPVTEEFIVK